MSLPAFHARSEGYSFVAVRGKTSGVIHVAFSEHFDRAIYPPPAGVTLCGRRVPNDWTQVGAKAWYTQARKCLICGGAIGPYATVKL